MDAVDTPGAPRPRLMDRIARQVLLGPAVVRRAAAGRARGPEESWMLLQAKPVRESYVREVLDGGGDPRLAEIWMLRQSDAVRESYVRDVLEPALGDRARDGR